MIPDMRRLMKITESATGRRVSFDDLPDEVKADICGNLADRHPYFLANGLDAEDARRNLEGLVKPPQVILCAVNTEQLAEEVSENRTSSSVVNKYAAMLRADPHFEFDPVLIASGRFYDGGHRVAAYAAAGRKTIPAVECGHIVNAPDETWEAWTDGDPDAIFEPRGES